jgi:hypothetical protein
MFDSFLVVAAEINDASLGLLEEAAAGTIEKS